MLIKTRKQGNSLTITVPSEFKISEGTTVEPELREDGIFYKFVNADENDFDVLILEDLVADGYEGESLIAAFKERKANVPVALKKLVKETKEESPVLTREELEKELEL